MNNNTRNTFSVILDDASQVFDQGYQARFIKTFLEDKEGWNIQIYDIVDPEYFDGYHKVLIKYILDFYAAYKTVATYDELMTIIFDKESDGILREQMCSTVEKIKQADLDYKKRVAVKDRAYDFFKSKTIKSALIDLASDWKSQTYGSMKLKLENALKSGEPKKIGHNYFRDVNERMVKDFRHPIPALRGLDEKMGGGLAPGELGLVMAPTGGGKSMMLVKMATTAMWAGKKVLYYTLELSEKVVAQRFDACLHNINLLDVWSFPDVIKENNQKLEQLGASLIIKEFPTKKATVDTFYAHMQALETNDGFKPDIVFIDYADIMKPLVVYKDKRHTLTEIYETIRGMAVELKVPIWTASQTNRGALGKDEFGLENIGESLGKAETADVVIAVARSLTDKKKAKIGFLKNRNGDVGFFLDYNFDTTNINISLDESEVTTSKFGIVQQQLSSDEMTKSTMDYISQYNNNITQ